MQSTNMMPSMEGAFMGWVTQGVDLSDFIDTNWKFEVLINYLVS